MKLGLKNIYTHNKITRFSVGEKGKSVSDEHNDNIVMKLDTSHSLP